MYKRFIAIICAIVFALVASVGRIAYIMFSGDYKVSAGYNSYSLDLSVLKSTLYDCNLNKLNNNKVEYKAIIRPNEKCLNELQYLFSKNEIREIKEELSKGYPVIRSFFSPSSFDDEPEHEVIDTTSTPAARMLNIDFTFICFYYFSNG